MLGFNNAKLELPDRPGLILSHAALPLVPYTFFTNKKSLSASDRFSGERYSARYLSPLGRKNIIIFAVLTAMTFNRSFFLRGKALGERRAAVM